MSKEVEISAIDDDISKRSFALELSNIKEMGLTEKKDNKKQREHIFRRVCCIKINRSWTIKRQIFVTTSVVFIIVLSIVTALIGVINIAIFFYLKKCREIYIIQELIYKRKLEMV